MAEVNLDTKDKVKWVIDSDTHGSGTVIDDSALGTVVIVDDPRPKHPRQILMFPDKSVLTLVEKYKEPEEEEDESKRG